MKGSSRLASIRPATEAEKRRAAVLCADLVTDHLDWEDPEAKEAVRVWMGVFGLDPRSIEPLPRATIDALREKLKAERSDAGLYETSDVP